MDKAKYLAMRQALLAVLPDTSPGISVAQAKEALLPQLPDELFPGGATAGWWLEAVQLDLEAKGIIRRAPVKPVHLYRVSTWRAVETARPRPARNSTTSARSTI